MTEGSRGRWPALTVLGATMVIVGLLISSDYLIAVDSPFTITCTVMPLTMRAGLPAPVTVRTLAGC